MRRQRSVHQSIWRKKPCYSIRLHYKGLVAGISEVIARFEGNITNLQAVFKGGDDPGDNIMIYEVDVPQQTDQQSLYRELKKRAGELKLEIDIQHRNIFEAIHRI